MESLLQTLFKWSQEEPMAPMQAFKKDGQWEKISTQECVNRVELLAHFLNKIGLEAGDVGVIYSYNCSEWVQMDLALMLIGASSAGVYTNSSIRTIHHIIQHSEAKLLVVDNYDSYRHLVGSKTLSQISSTIKKVVVLLEPANNLVDWPDDVISFSQALEIGRTDDVNQSKTYEERLNEINRQNRAMLIYTSGTTGNSKAVCLTHENLAFASECYAQSWHAPQTGRLFSFLPLAHVAERITNLGIGIGNRYTVYFCSNPASIAAEMREVEPTIALAVPRLWDKFREGVEKRISRLPPKQQTQISWAMKIGADYWNQKINSRFISPWLKMRYVLADYLVLKKFRQQLGLGRSLRVVSGAAALSRATLEWYRGIGVVIIEAYALSESSGVLTCGKPNQETIGTVGFPYRGVEVRLASDGEIETRGKHVFQGYYKDSIATDEMIQDGWLRTGDIGQKDSNGCIKILGRKREIIKTAEGKMVSPLYLEAQLENHPWIDQAIVIGNEKPYLTALLTLSEEGKMVKLSGSASDWREEIQQHIDQLNFELASHERIKQFQILTHHFSIDRDESTATLKVKRKVVETNYREQISSMYH